MYHGTMRGLAWTFVLLAGCGRLGFNDRADVSPDSAPLVSPDSGPPVAGLTSYWSFDGANPLAESTGGHDAACTSCPVFDGSTATFDGSSSCLDVPGLQTWMPASFTISAWVSLAGPTGPIIAKESDGSCPGPQLDSSNAHPGLVQLDSNDALHNNAYTPTAMLAMGQWHHVAATWDGTTQSVFVDGVCNCSIVPGIGTLDNVKPFSIGCYPGAGTFFAGSLDEIRLYDRVLAPEEIAQLYAFNGRTAPTPQACAATCANVVP